MLDNAQMTWLNPQLIDGQEYGHPLSISTGVPLKLAMKGREVTIESILVTLFILQFFSGKTAWQQADLYWETSFR